VTALLCGERDKYLRFIAGVPDGAAVDLSLVRLPDDALIFPSPVGPELDLTQPRDPPQGHAKRCQKTKSELDKLSV
jgi:integrase